MLVKEIDSSIFVVPEQTGIIYKPNKFKDADAVYAEINGSFHGDSIIIPETIEFSEDTKEKYGIDAIEVQGVCLLKIEKSNRKICIHISKNVKDIRIEGGCNSCKLGFEVVHDNEKYHSEQFSLYTKDMTELIRYYSEDFSVIELPDSIQHIYKGAFSQLNIDKLILPIGIEDVSFEDYNANSIKEVICKGNITSVTGTPFSSTPNTLRVNSKISEIAWKNYNLWGNKESKKSRRIMALFPLLGSFEKTKGMIRLHCVPGSQEAIDNRIDYKEMVIILDPNVERISIHENIESIEISARHQWIKEIREWREPKQFYDKEYKRALITFDNLDRSFEVLEDVDAVKQLIQEAL